MQYLNDIIRRNTRDMLRQNWGKAVALTVTLLAASLMGALLESAIGAATGVYGLSRTLFSARYPLRELFPWRLLGSLGLTAGIGLLELCLLGPLILGVSEWFFGLSYGYMDGEMGVVFRHFRTPRHFARGVWLAFQTALRSLFYTAVLLLPGGGLIFLSGLFTRGNPSSLDRIMAIMGMAIGACLLFLGGVTAWILTRRYVLAPYFIALDDSLSARRALKKSVQTTRGFKTGLAWFQFSFAGWWLLGILVLPLFYVIPYYWGSTALYARTVMEARRVLRRLGEAAETPVETEVPADGDPAADCR